MSAIDNEEKKARDEAVRECIEFLRQLRNGLATDAVKGYAMAQNLAGRVLREYDKAVSQAKRENSPDIRADSVSDSSADFPEAEFRDMMATHYGLSNSWSPSTSDMRAARWVFERGRAPYHDIERDFRALLAHAAHLEAQLADVSNKVVLERKMRRKLEQQVRDDYVLEAELESKLAEAQDEIERLRSHSNEK